MSVLCHGAACTVMKIFLVLVCSSELIALISVRPLVLVNKKYHWGYPLPIGLGNVPSGIRGTAPYENEFGVFCLSYNQFGEGKINILFIDNYSDTSKPIILRMSKSSFRIMRF